MGDRRDRLMYPRIITLGKIGPEDEDEDLIALHAWLVRKLTGDDLRIIRWGRTVYLTSTELNDNNNAISRWIRHSRVDDDGGPATLVLDASDTSDLLPDPRQLAPE